MNEFNTRKVESDYAVTWMSEDGIVFQEMKRGIKVISFEIAETLVIDRYEVAGANDIVAIFIANDALKVDDRAREFYKTDPPYKHIIAEGVVVNNHIAKVIGNMVLKFNKSKVPFEFFTSVGAARKWLEKEYGHVLPLLRQV